MNHTAPIGNKGVLATWRKNIPIRACYRAACAAAHRRSFRCNFGGTKFRPWHRVSVGRFGLVFSVSSRHYATVDIPEGACYPISFVEK